jgi:hypothetical protein
MDGAPLLVVLIGVTLLRKLISLGRARHIISVIVCNFECNEIRKIKFIYLILNLTW